MDNDNINIIEYVQENFVGLCLLGLAFLIIYVVDHINRINALFFSTPSPIPGVSNAISIPVPSKRRKKH